MNTHPGVRPDYFFAALNDCICKQFTSDMAAVMRRGYESHGLSDAADGCMTYQLILVVAGAYAENG